MFDPATIDPKKVTFKEIKSVGVRKIDRRMVNLNDIYHAPIKDNPTRSKGKNVPHIERLVNSLSLGIDYSLPPPILMENTRNEGGLITNHDPVACYHRLEALRKLGYSQWVFDIYQIPTDDSISFEDALRTLQLKENNHTPSLATTEDDVVKTISTLISHKSRLIQPEEDSIRDYVEEVCGLLHYQTKAKIIRDVIRRCQSNGVMVKSDVITYTSTDVKDFLSKKTDLLAGGEEDFKRNMYGWSVMEGYEYEILMNSIKRFAETDRESYFTLHTKSPTEVYSVEQRRAKMKNTFGHLESSLLKVFDFYSEHGRFPWQIKGYLPQLASNGEKEYIYC
jgi:hypothetical protein